MSRPEMAKEAANFIKWLLSLRISSVYPNEELCFEFWRAGSASAGVGQDNDGDDGKWSGGGRPSRGLDGEGLSLSFRAYQIG